MIRVRRTIVQVMLAACEHVDRLWDWPAPFPRIAAQVGCPSGLALWSSQLDERWQTGVWEAIR